MFALFEVFLLKLGISSENVNCIEPYLFLLENEKKMTAAIYTIKIRIFFADMLQSCGTSVTFILVIHHQLQIKRYGHSNVPDQFIRALTVSASNNNLKCSMGLL